MQEIPFQPFSFPEDFSPFANNDIDHQLTARIETLTMQEASALIALLNIPDGIPPTLSQASPEDESPPANPTFIRSQGPSPSPAAETLQNHILSPLSPSPTPPSSSGVEYTAIQALEHAIFDLHHSIDELTARVHNLTLHMNAHLRIMEDPPIPDPPDPPEDSESSSMNPPESNPVLHLTRTSTSWIAHYQGNANGEPDDPSHENGLPSQPTSSEPPESDPDPLTDPELAVLLSVISEIAHQTDPHNPLIHVTVSYLDNDAPFPPETPPGSPDDSLEFFLDPPPAYHTPPQSPQGRTL